MRRFLLGAMVVAGVGCTNHPMRVMNAASVSNLGGGEPEAVTDFRESTNQLATNRNPEHRATVHAMHLMASAVRTLPSSEVRDQAAQDIDEQAKALEKNHDHLLHAELPKRALMDATEALEAARKQNDAEGWSERIDTAKTAVGSIDESLPYLQQTGAIGRAFLAVSYAFGVPEVTGEEVKTLKVERWGADRRGQNPDILGACGGPASTVLIERTAADVTAALFTFGLYTPLHVRVTCPTRTFHTAKR